MHTNKSGTAWKLVEKIGSETINCSYSALNNGVLEVFTRDLYGFILVLHSVEKAILQQGHKIDKVVEKLKSGDCYSEENLASYFIPSKPKKEVFILSQKNKSIGYIELANRYNTFLEEALTEIDGQYPLTIRMKGVTNEGFADLEAHLKQRRIKFRKFENPVQIYMLSEGLDGYTTELLKKYPLLSPKKVRMELCMVNENAS